MSIQMTTSEYLRFQKMINKKEIKEKYGNNASDVIIELVERVEKLEKQIKGMETRINNLTAKVLSLKGGIENV